MPIPFPPYLGATLNSSHEKERRILSDSSAPVKRIQMPESCPWCVKRVGVTGSLEEKLCLGLSPAFQSKPSEPISPHCTRSHLSCFLITPLALKFPRSCWTP